MPKALEEYLIQKMILLFLLQDKQHVIADYQNNIYINVIQL